MKKVKDFIIGSYEEFTKRVTWSSWDELQSSTLVVALFTVIVSSVVALVDWGIKSGIVFLFE